MLKKSQQVLNFKQTAVTLVFQLIIALSVFNNTSAQVNVFNPSDWKFESQREDIAPVHFINSEVMFRGTPVLTLSGGGKEYANGSWYHIADIVPEKYYRFRVHFKSINVEHPWRSVLARILWMDANNRLIGVAEYPRTLWRKSPENWDIIEQIYKAPEKASKAKFELVYRWDEDGWAHFGDFSFTEVNELPSRIVRMATIHYRPRNTKSSQENLNLFAELINKAGASKADIVCLPEAMTMAGTGLNYLSASEPIPGNATRFLGEVARKNNLYLVAGLLEKEGNIVYNTSVLINRNGELAGKYRKASLPREEIDGGITPGKDYPVFDTDFGRVGMMICWDVSFPEVARQLTLKGAEIILMPIWGGNLTLTQARAIENQVYLITSSYGMKSAIFDLTGEIMEEADDNNPVVVTEVDLNEQFMWPWLGDFKNRIPRELPLAK